MFNSRPSLRSVATLALLASSLASSQSVEPSSPPASTPPTADSPATAPSTQPTGTIPATDGPAIRAQMGKSATVSGVVFRAQLSSTGRVFRIEFKDARASGFNSVIFERSLKLFRDTFGEDLSAAFTGKTVEITGTIEEYRGNPQIILNRPDQIRILP